MEIVPAEYLPNGMTTSRVLSSLASALQKLEYWHRQHTGQHLEPPYLRLLQVSSEGRVSALVQSDTVTFKLIFRKGSWVMLGDALKVSD